MVKEPKLSFSFTPVKTVIKLQGATMVEKKAVGDVVSILQSDVAACTDKAYKFARHDKRFRINNEDMALAIQYNCMGFKPDMSKIHVSGLSAHPAVKFTPLYEFMKKTKRNTSATKEAVKMLQENLTYKVATLATFSIDAMKITDRKKITSEYISFVNKDLLK